MEDNESAGHARQHGCWCALCALFLSKSRLSLIWVSTSTTNSGLVNNTDRLRVSRLNSVYLSAVIWSNSFNGDRFAYGSRSGLRNQRASYERTLVLMPIPLKIPTYTLEVYLAHVTIPTLRDYILVAQDRPKVEHCKRSPDGPGNGISTMAWMQNSPSIH